MAVAVESTAKTVAFMYATDPLATSIGAYDVYADSYEADNSSAMAAEVAEFVSLLEPGAHVLDAGCGPGRDMARFHAAGLSPVGVELNYSFLKRAIVYGPVYQCDIRAMPFTSRTFDGLWACASLVHLNTGQAAEALRELHRVSRPGAPAHISVKSASSGNASANGWEDTARGRRWFHRWTPATFASACESAGFTVNSLVNERGFITVRASA